MDDLPVLADLFENQRHPPGRGFEVSVIFLRLFPFAGHIGGRRPEHFDPESGDVEIDVLGLRVAFFP